MKANPCHILWFITGHMAASFTACANEPSTVPGSACIDVFDPVENTEEMLIVQRTDIMAFAVAGDTIYTLGKAVKTIGSWQPTI